MESGYNLGNVLRNMTKKQKIGAVVFLAVIIILVIILMFLMFGDQQATDESSGDGDSMGQNEAANVKEETYENDDGYTVTKKTTTYENGETVVTETKMDEYGNVTTVDPDLITTYFPYQVMRKHTSEELVDSGFDYTLRYSLDLDEEARIITAIIEYCDVEADKALAQQYLDSIPLDLSAYTVNYETFSEDAICEE